jgi:hypothetical protein
MHPPKQRSAIYFEHLFFNLFMHLVTLKQVQSRLAVRSAKRNDIFVEMMENFFSQPAKSIQKSLPHYTQNTADGKDGKLFGSTQNP